MSADKGAKIFKTKCAQCHTTEKGGANLQGPNLFGVVGRGASGAPGFSFSAASKKSGVTWTEDQLDKYLTNPKKFMKGTKMIFAGLKKKDDRAAIIAYLKQFA